MIGVLATINIQEGKNNEFETLAKQLVEQVNANEDGAIYYDLYQQDATTYVFMEKYKDKAALDIHQQTEYYKSIGGQLGAYMAGAPDVKVMKEVQDLLT